MRTNTARFLAATVLLSAGMACQPKPGEYRVYRITSLAEKADEGCPGGVSPEPGDSSTFFGASTVAIFATDPDTYFIEFNGAALTGTRSGHSYTFSGESVDISDVGGMATTHLTRNLDITLDIKGHEISGSYVEVEKLVCEGNSAACMVIEGYTCTRTDNFFGGEIHDVELEYPVGGGGVGP